jgi:hypothetical protein
VRCFKADLRWWNDLVAGNLRSAFLLSHLISNTGGIIEPEVTCDSAPTPAPDAADADDTPRTPATPSGSAICTDFPFNSPPAPLPHPCGAADTSPQCLRRAPTPPAPHATTASSLRPSSTSTAPRCLTSRALPPPSLP